MTMVTCYVCGEKTSDQDCALVARGPDDPVYAHDECTLEALDVAKAQLETPEHMHKRAVMYTEVTRRFAQHVQSDEPEDYGARHYAELAVDLCFELLQANPGCAKYEQRLQQALQGFWEHFNALEGS